MMLLSNDRRLASGGALAPTVDRSPRPSSPSGTTQPWDVRVVETDSAVVLLAGSRAYKLKKSVKPGPTGSTTPHDRLEAYRKELRLNRRFSPDVYLGVLDITDGAGVPKDHLLAMTRLPADRQLTELARRDADTTIDVGAALDQVADRLVSVHHASPIVPPHFATATPQDLWRRWAEDLGALRELETSIGHRLVDSCESLAARYLRNGDDLFARRIAEGHVRDGHGDLRADHVFCLDDGPRIIGCLDDDPKRRCRDVLADVAALVLDLEHLGRPDLARRFSERYRAVSGTTWPASLEHHYVAARAADLARVAADRAQRAEGDARDTALSLVRAYAMLAARHLHLGQPKLILVGGPAAARRSAVARGLRDRGIGVLLEAPSDAAGAGGSPDADGETQAYDDLLDAVEQWLTTGESVIIDAAWDRPADRLAARRTAERFGAGMVEMLCHARPDTLTLRGTEEPGEADAAEPGEVWPEAVVLDTDSTDQRVLDTAGQVIFDHWAS
jgi:hypothetical protein